jgi:hypothetical protein
LAFNAPKSKGRKSIYEKTPAQVRQTRHRHGDILPRAGMGRCVRPGNGDCVSIRPREIQFDADADWPHTDPANAGIRVEFQLPPDRMMK